MQGKLFPRLLIYVKGVVVRERLLSTSSLASGRRCTVDTRLSNIETELSDVKELLNALRDDIQEMKVKQEGQRTKLATVVGVISFALAMAGKWLWAAITGHPG